jgi:hypothetical protein
MDISRVGRTLHSISFYLFSIVSFALLLQWFWTFEILNDPVKAVKQKNSHYFTKVLGIVLACSLLLLGTRILFDCMSWLTTAYILAAVMSIWMFAVLACYTILYSKFLSLIHANQELKELIFQVHTFFLFMIIILLCKIVICSL